MEISVEISPTCNQRCPNCNLAARVHGGEHRDDPELVAKIIKHVPLRARLLFVGLGEPTLPLGQQRIAAIMAKRPDVMGYIQSNGSCRLSDDILRLVDEGRVEVGISYDSHHDRGGRERVDIQPEAVTAMSIAIAPDDECSQEMLHRLRQFPRLNRILVDPLLASDGSQPLVPWEKIKEVCMFFVTHLPDVAVYTEIGDHIKELPGFRAYYAAATAELIHCQDDWYRVADFLVKKYTCMGSRILIDGTVLLVQTLADQSWGILDKSPVRIPIESHCWE